MGRPWPGCGPPARSAAGSQLCLHGVLWRPHSCHLPLRGGRSAAPQPGWLIHGPGCPVCVLPTGWIEQALRPALDHPVTLWQVYGDTLRVPAAGLSLLARAMGPTCGMIYPFTDALTSGATGNPRGRWSLRSASETTTPPTSGGPRGADTSAGPDHFSVLCCHADPAGHPCDCRRRDYDGEVGQIDGFIGPAHTSASVIGTGPYVPFAATFRKPVVTAGSEP